MKLRNKLKMKPYFKNWLDRRKKAALDLLWMYFLFFVSLLIPALVGVIAFFYIAVDDERRNEELLAKFPYTVKNPPTAELSLNVDNIFDEKTLKFTHFECSLAPPSVIYVLKSDFAVDGDDLLSLFQVRNSSCPDSPDFIFNAPLWSMAHFIEKDTAAYTHRMDLDRLDRIARIELGYGES